MYRNAGTLVIRNYWYLDSTGTQVSRSQQELQVRIVTRRTQLSWSRSAIPGSRSHSKLRVPGVKERTPFSRIYPITTVSLGYQQVSRSLELSGGLQNIGIKLISFVNIYSAVVGSKLLEAAVPDRCWARLWPRFNAGLDNGLGSMEGYAMSPVRCRVRQWPLYVLG